MTSFAAATSVPVKDPANISMDSISSVSRNDGHNSTPPSPSPTTSSFALPDNKAAYTHPYAIKTTSTALLSRSGSNAGSPHRVNEGKHRYIPPPSPSPTEGHGNSAAGLPMPKRGARHRYSRSLTEEGPKPLPTPPPGGLSGSEKEAAEGEGDTPRRIYRPRHLGTSPRPISAPGQAKGFKFPSAEVTANSNPTENVPDDVKTWTPFQLSEYLAVTLRVSSRKGNATEALLPERVAQDIAKFVREKRISGRLFLRLSEGDLEGYGVNQLWRGTLLSASRALRHRTIKGRIWGISPDADSFDHEEGGGLSDVSTSSSASASSFENNGITSERKTRHRQSSSAGRVRDMVDSLERSASVGEEDGSASESRRSESPTKKALPSRGRVDSLFGAEETITQQKREPRMLPFPPTIVPHHTGPAHTHTYLYTPVNTLVPSHTGPAYPPSDYELGFRASAAPLSHAPSGILSPHPSDPTKQTFIVRHNPSPNGSKQAVDADETVKKPGSKRRLLPFPPVMGEAQLHHPRPRRTEAVGLVTVEGFASSGSGVDESAAGDESSSTSAYETALDNEDEEQTVEELLKHSHPISAVEAWESMEMGDTVKRVQGDGSESVPGSARNSRMVDVKVDGISSDTNVEDQEDTQLDGKTKTKFQTMEFGRKSGRKRVSLLTSQLDDDEGLPTESVADKQGSVREARLRRPAILGLFENHAEQAPPSDAVAACSGREEQEEKSLPVEPLIDEPTSLSQPKGDQWQAQNLQLDVRELQLDARQAQLDSREEEVKSRESQLDVDERALQECTRDLETSQIKVTERRDELDERGSTLDTREKVLDGRELDVVKREALAEERESRAAQRESAVTKREIEVGEKEKGLEASQRQFSSEIDGRGKLLDDREAKLARLARERDRVEGARAERQKAPESPILTSLAHLRSCIRGAIVPVLGEDRVKEIFGTALSPPDTPTPSSSTPKPDTSNITTENLPARVSPLNIKRDFFLARGEGLRVSYIVLMSIGMCAVVLRVLRLGRRKG